MHELYRPFRYGTVFNPITSEVKQVREPVYSNIEIAYHSRLNAMALDPAGVTVDDNMVFTPGEVVIATDFLRYATVNLCGSEGSVVLSDRVSRPSIVKHAVELIRNALGVNHGLHIDFYDAFQMHHSGLGSSSGTIAAVAATVNELYGCPLKPVQIVPYLAQNHGEEIEGDMEMMTPVQCIGGGASAGFFQDGILIIAGESTVIGSVSIDRDIIVGIPRDFVPQDGKTMMQKELANLNKFRATGKRWAPHIAYELVHKVLPDMAHGNIVELSNLVYEYRFNMGSNQNCSFVYPPIVDIAERIRFLKEDNHVEMISLSSVGPAFFAIGKNLSLCREVFEQNGMDCKEAKILNSTYQIVRRQ